MSQHPSYADIYVSAIEWAMDLAQRAAEEALDLFGAPKRSPQQRGAEHAKAVYEIALTEGLEGMPDQQVDALAAQMGVPPDVVRKARSARVRAMLRVNGATERLPEPEGLDDA